MILVSSCAIASAQPSVQFDGTYIYSLNAAASGTIAVTEDGSLAVSLSQNTNVATITSFDPLTGQKFDTELTNGTSSWIAVATSGAGYRVAVRLNGGGRIAIYDMDASGAMTFRANGIFSEVTEAGNMVLSRDGTVGFSRTTNGTNNQVVAFSLDTGAELGRVNSVVNFLTIFDNGTRRLLGTGSSRRLDLIDASNPAAMQLSNITLPATRANFGAHETSSFFSADGNYIFATNSFAALSAVNTTTNQIVYTHTNLGFFSAQLEGYDKNGTRLLVMRGAQEDGSFRGIKFFNATDVPNTTLVNEREFGADIIRDMAFNRAGNRLFVNTDNRFTAYLLPGFTKYFENTVDTNLAMNIVPFSPEGRVERILTTWGSTNNFRATAYLFTDRTNRIANFDGDSRSDIALYRPDDATWYSLDSSTGYFRTRQLGQTGDIPTPGDYDGDGRTDFAFYRPSTGRWQILETTTQNQRTVFLGGGIYRPAQADFDGDGKTDVAVYRNSPNRWFVILSGNGDTISRAFPGANPRPVPADFDGDGSADFAVFDRAGNWNITYSSTGNNTFIHFGTGGDIPAASDFDGDGISDLAVFRPSDGTWYIQQSFKGFLATRFGTAGDIPAAADYDGDGIVDIGVYRPSEGMWYYVLSSEPFTGSGGFRAVRFGISSDIPVPSVQNF